MRHPRGRTLSGPTRRAIGALTAIAVLAALTCAAPAAAGTISGAAPQPAPEPGNARTSTIGTTEIARGRVLDAAASPVHRASVVLYAWPSNDVTDLLTAGDRVTLHPVARAWTSRQGRFSLRLEDLAQLMPYRGADHTVSLEILASAADGSFAPYAFSRTLEVRAARPSTASSPAALRAPGERLRLLPPAAAESAATAGVTPLDVDLALEDPATTAQRRVTSVVPVRRACAVKLLKSYKPRWTLVGQHYSTTRDVTSNFVYSLGADSELGVGVSSTGKFGSFHASGTTTKSSSGTVTFKPVKGATSAYRLTKFKYGKFLIVCVGAFGIITRHYEARATRWVSGAKTLFSGPIKARFCTTFEKGSKFAKRNTRAVRWTNGVDISGAIGIDLSARTGYSRDAVVRFAFHRKHHLCGSGDFPGGHPYQLEAKK